MNSKHIFHLSTIVALFFIIAPLTSAYCFGGATCQYSCDFGTEKYVGPCAGPWDTWPSESYDCCEPDYSCSDWGGTCQTGYTCELLSPPRQSAFGTCPNYQTCCGDTYTCTQDYSQDCVTGGCGQNRPNGSGTCPNGQYCCGEEYTCSDTFGQSCSSQMCSTINRKDGSGTCPGFDTCCGEEYTCPNTFGQVCANSCSFENRRPGTGTCPGAETCCGEEYTCVKYGGYCVSNGRVGPPSIYDLTPMFANQGADFWCYPDLQDLVGGLCDYDEVCCRSNPNAYPNTPTITGPTIGLVNVNHSFSVTGSDPAGDNLRYGVSLSGANAVELWLPSQTGLVASGTTQTFQKNWSTAGAYTLKALTVDSGGLYSVNWASHSIQIVSVLSVDAGGPYNQTVGTPIQLNGLSAGGSVVTSWLWTITDNQGNCTLTNSTAQTPTINCTNIYKPTTLSLSITDSLNQTASDITTVTLIPLPTCSVLEVSPAFVRKSDPVTIIIEFNDFQVDPLIAVDDTVSCGNGITTRATCYNLTTTPYSGKCSATCNYVIDAVAQNLTIGANVSSQTQNKVCTSSSIRVSPNQAPLVPLIIRTTPGIAKVTSPQSFDISSTDPDGDGIRYQVDWNGDGIYDELIPANSFSTPDNIEITNFSPSGVAVNGTYTWTTPGLKTFKVRAEDSFSLAKSDWATSTLNLTVGPSCAVIPSGIITSSYDANIDFNINFSSFSGPAITSSNLNSKCYSGTNPPTNAEFRDINPTENTFLMKCPNHKNDGNVSVLIQSNVSGESAICSTDIIINLTANAGADLSAAPRQNVLLNGTAFGGTGIYTYNWAKIRDVNPANPKCTLTNATTLTPTLYCDVDALMSGDYNAILTFTVNDGKTFATDVVNVSITYPSLAPFSISAGPDTSGLIGQNIQLTGTATGGLKFVGGPQDYIINWSFVSPSPFGNCRIDDNKTLTPKVYCAGLDANGVKILRLDVNDAAYQTRFDEVNVTVNDITCPNLEMNCRPIGSTFPNEYQTPYNCSTSGVLKACYSKGYPPVSSDVNSITSIIGEVTNDGIFLTLTCTHDLQADINLYIVSPVFQILVTPARIDCNTTPARSMITPITPLVANNLLLEAIADITPNTTKCERCKDQAFFNYSIYKKAVIPDNEPVLVLIIAIFVVAIISLKKKR